MDALMWKCVFDFVNVALEDLFLCGILTSLEIPALTLASTALYLLLHLGLLPMVMLLILKPFFFNNVETNAIL